MSVPDRLDLTRIEQHAGRAQAERTRGAADLLSDGPAGAEARRLARQALDEWDRREDLTDNQVESGLYVARAVAVAETLRALLDELAKDRALRLGS